MTEKQKLGKTRLPPNQSETAKGRRAILKKLGRFAAVTAPTVTLLLAAEARPGAAASPVSCAAIQQ